MTSKHKYIVLLLKEIHEEDHGGDGRVVDKVRSRFWVPQAAKVVKGIRRRCFKCKFIEKRLKAQIMAPLPTYRMMVSHPWTVVSLDLFGPITVRDSIKKRVTGKCWAIIFTCASTRAVHLDCTEDYSCDSVLQSIQRFTSIRGKVSKFISDQGKQLTAAKGGLSKKEKDDLEEAVGHVPVSYTHLTLPTKA